MNTDETIANETIANTRAVAELARVERARVRLDGAKALLAARGRSRSWREWLRECWRTRPLSRTKRRRIDALRRDV